MPSVEKQAKVTMVTKEGDGEVRDHMSIVIIHVGDTLHMCDPAGRFDHGATIVFRTESSTKRSKPLTGQVQIDSDGHVSLAYPMRFGDRTNKPCFIIQSDLRLDPPEHGEKTLD